MDMHVCVYADVRVDDRMTGYPDESVCWVKKC